jgi:hypothetical protein
MADHESGTERRRPNLKSTGTSLWHTVALTPLHFVSNPAAANITVPASESTAEGAGAAAGTPPPPPPPPASSGTGGGTASTPGTVVSGFDATKLDTISTWSAGGFVLLASLLTFFGIKDGYLDRILAEDPEAAVAVFVLIGAGIVISLMGGATSASIKVFSGFVLLGLAVPVGYAARALTSIDAGPSRDTVVVSLVLLAALVLFCWSRSLELALPVSLLAIAVAATSAGLFTAVRLSVASKATSEALHVTATVKAGGSDVTVTVKGERQPHELRRLVVTGFAVAHGHAVHHVIGHDDFEADQVDKVDESFSLPVSLFQWNRVTVTVLCGTDFATVCDGTPRQVIWHGAPAAGGSVSGSLSMSSGASMVTEVDAHGFRPGSRVQARLVGLKDGKAKRMSLVTIAADSKGDATYSAHSAVAAGQSWQLQTRRCDGGCTQWHVMSRLRVTGS